MGNEGTATPARHIRRRPWERLTASKAFADLGLQCSFEIPHLSDLLLSLEIATWELNHTMVAGREVD